METFNNTDSWISMGRHKLAPYVQTTADVEMDDATDRACRKVNDQDIYSVSLAGKTRVCTFEYWHGVHALFYSSKDDWRFIVHYSDLRQVVKRVKV